MTSPLLPVFTEAPTFAGPHRTDGRRHAHRSLGEALSWAAERRGRPEEDAVPRTRSTTELTNATIHVPEETEPVAVEGVSVAVGGVIVWTETSNACACGGHEDFGTRTLAAIRPEGMTWLQGAVLRTGYIILSYREDALSLADDLSALRAPGYEGLGVIGFGGERVRVDPGAMNDLVSVLRERVAPMMGTRNAQSEAGHG